MLPRQLFVRCYAKRTKGMWVAFCLDFALGAQADTLAEARKKLDEQIREYVHDALDGEDREHAEYLLRRRAPLSYWMEYWGIVALHKFASLVHRSRRPAEAAPFREILPMVPSVC